MTGFRFLLIGIVILAAAVLVRHFYFDSSGSASATWPHGSRPNIVLIIADDQRWDQLSLVQSERGEEAGFSCLETPNLDALAKQGMRFRNAFVTTSICSPSRASMLTGQYVHTHGIIDNLTSFSSRPTWATTLQDAGYTTAYFGKWHHGMQKARPGFDFAATFRGQGDYFDTTFIVGENLLDARTDGYVDDRSVDFLVDFLENPSDGTDKLTS